MCVSHVNTTDVMMILKSKKMIKRILTLIIYIYIKKKKKKGRGEVWNRGVVMSLKSVHALYKK
jgi:hypothetical protein